MQYDARDMTGHLDVTQRASAGTLSMRVKETTSQVMSVGALSHPLGCMSVRGPQFLILHSVLSCLRWPVLFRLRNFL